VFVDSKQVVAASAGAVGLIGPAADFCRRRLHVNFRVADNVAQINLTSPQPIRGVSRHSELIGAEIIPISGISRRGIKYRHLKIFLGIP
jgi:hypothetical protein